MEPSLLIGYRAGGKMRTLTNLGKLRRVRYRIHYTWLFAVVLVPAAVITQFEPTYPLWQRAVLGIFASLMLFVAVAVRESVLGFITVRKGITIESVVLFVFGGMAQVDSETSSPSLELLLAAVGQLFNIIIAGIFSVIYLVLKGSGNVMIEVLMQWMAFIWFMLVLLHFIPGFPLDGGRALRVLFWKLTDNYVKATRITSWLGWGFGLVMTAGGISLLVLTPELFAGIFLVVFGLLLQNAATIGRRRVLQSVIVSDDIPNI
jgi:Zn-dependent protease